MEKKANVQCSCDENRKLAWMLQMWPFYYSWTTFSHKMAENTFFSLPELALCTCARHEAVRRDKCCPSHQ